MNNLEAQQRRDWVQLTRAQAQAFWHRGVYLVFTSCSRRAYASPIVDAMIGDRSIDDAHGPNTRFYTRSVYYRQYVKELKASVRDLRKGLAQAERQLALGVRKLEGKSRT